MDTFISLLPTIISGITSLGSLLIKPDPPKTHPRSNEDYGRPAHDNTTNVNSGETSVNVTSVNEVKSVNINNINLEKENDEKPDLSLQLYTGLIMLLIIIALIIGAIVFIVKLIKRQSSGYERSIEEGSNSKDNLSYSFNMAASLLGFGNFNDNKHNRAPRNAYESIAISSTLNIDKNNMSLGINEVAVQFTTYAYYRRGVPPVLSAFAPQSNYIWSSSEEQLSPEIRHSRPVKRWSKLEPSVRFADGPFYRNIF
uniref:Uncharacterized protein n=1 Tax=Parastrongyloides trichosuri TaxID=131310 RepID=A0A0N4ZQD2_PARTI